MKCALVTGGSRGIGRAVCLKMAGMGYYVLVNYVSNNEAAIDTLFQITEKGGKGELLQFDVSKREQVKTILGGWIEKNKDNRFFLYLPYNAVHGPFQAPKRIYDKLTNI